jgi:hypothetical protein
MPAFSAALLGYLMYRSGLVPRLIPAMGLIGAPLVHARNEARRQREGVRVKGRRDRSDLLLGAVPPPVDDVQGLQPIRRYLGRASAERGVRPLHEKDRQRCMLRPARRSHMPPTCPPNSRNWPSLAVASRGQRSRLQHWTAPIIGNHLILDPLVMRRSAGSAHGHRTRRGYESLGKSQGYARGRPVRTAAMTSRIAWLAAAESASSYSSDSWVVSLATRWELLVDNVAI